MLRVTNVYFMTLLNISFFFLPLNLMQESLSFTFRVGHTYEADTNSLEACTQADIATMVLLVWLYEDHVSERETVELLSTKGEVF